MKTTTIAILSLLVLSLAATQSAQAISLGLLSDFEDGTLQGWSGNSAPTNIATGGPAGVGDNFLQIGSGNRFATKGQGSNFTGPLDANVSKIQVDLMRPSSDPGPLDMRFVMFGPGTGNRWTSSNATVVPNDDIWRTYIFSLLESDLTQVAGADNYANLVSNVNRVMFRHDPGAPDANGISAPGTLGIDNITAIPEPSTVLLLLAGFGLQCLAIRRR